MEWRDETPECEGFVLLMPGRTGRMGRIECVQDLFEVDVWCEAECVRS